MTRLRKHIWRCLGFLVFLALAAVLLGSTMPPKIVQGEEFSLIGIAARTNNANEMTGNGVIARQWNKFFSGGILAAIPHKIDPTIYAVYSDYASDRKGDYTFFIGVKVSDTSSIPAGMVAKKVPGGKFAVITTEKGPVQKVVPEAWQKIWRLEDDSQLGGVRSYKADFELYDQRARDPQNSQADIYIGIK
jgi:predicted transcriptional regulator YdeE